MKTWHTTLLALAAAAFLGSAAHAVTLTFEAVPDGQPGCPPNPESIQIDGFAVSNCPGYYVTADAIHLDDSGTAFPSFVDFSRPDPFNVLSMDIEGLGSSFIDVATPVAYDNVLATGYRDGALIATQLFSATGPGLATYSFDTSFAALDLLRIAQILPGPADRAAYPNASCQDAPCGHVNLLSVTLSEIPLPASLPLLASMIGIGGLGGWRLRARRK